MDPLQIHPENPHYFLFRGKPTVLITSGEHYGAVLNADFDYIKYLDTLARDGLNNTRIFVGSYCEPAGAFKISENTLAPAEGSFLCPWRRSDLPGYANGGNKFDLTKWDAAYFARLKDFVSRASKCEIIVEINLFCPFYQEGMWDLSPMNSRNNINGIGKVSGAQAYSLEQNDGLLAVQEAMVRKVVTELRDCDNLYYEIMNEPYIRDVAMAWQEHIIEVVVATEKEWPRQHLVSLNIANRKAKVDHVHPAVSILNFHYAWPPDTVEMNYGLNCVLGDNETGFNGRGDFFYRREAWAFILAGGGLYNNLDYSFAVGREDGTFAHPKQPGGGSAALRFQLSVLSKFIHRFDFVHMRPSGVVEGLPEGFSAYALEGAGKEYAVYICTQENEPSAEVARLELQLDLPKGTYRLEWIDSLTGATDLEEQLVHGGGKHLLASPAFLGDIALRVMAE